MMGCGNIKHHNLLLILARLNILSCDAFVAVIKIIHFHGLWQYLKSYILIGCGNIKHPGFIWVVTI